MNSAHVVPWLTIICFFCRWLPLQTFGNKRGLRRHAGKPRNEPRRFIRRIRNAG